MGKRAHLSKLFFDGSFRPVKKLYGTGAVIYFPQKRQMGYGFGNGRDLTSPLQVEYSALSFGLHMARFFEIEELVVFGDALNVIEQMNGERRVHSKTIIDYYDTANRLAEEFSSIKFQHVVRKLNDKAHKLAKKGIQSAADHPQWHWYMDGDMDGVLSVDGTPKIAERTAVQAIDE